MVTAVMLTVLVTTALILVGCAASAQPTSNPGTNTTSADTNASKTPTGAINVVSREDGSGTRGAFVELFEVQSTDAQGKAVDATTLSAVITNSTSVMLTTVAGDNNAIGYISLGSLDTSVKALNIDGAQATTANVKSGSYTISRPFNIATKGTPSPEAQDFIDFILSTEGQKVVADNHYIAANEKATAYKNSGVSGKLVVAGSSSVTPVMEKLQEAYATLNPGLEVEIQQGDSSTGMSSTIDGICDIGMASRELKDSETGSGLISQIIAIDGIAVIVNNSNGLSELDKEQVRDIFLGDVTRWEELGA
jgi:phosphate transport system substrate-binding protein